MANDSITEEWRSVEGFEGYEVSDMGRVRSWRSNSAGDKKRDTPRVMAPSLKKNGYLQVNLWRDGLRATKTVHSLVATAFFGHREEGKEVRHLNGVKHDNRVGNLAWGTHSENVLDAFDHGTHPGFARRGPDHNGLPSKPRGHHGAQAKQERRDRRKRLGQSPNSSGKLTGDQVLEIRALAGTMTYRELARRFGICAQSAHSIVTRKVWKHI